MNRQTVNIGQHSFICDYIPNTELDYNVKSKFNMLRPVEIYDNKIKTREIIIFEKTLLKKSVYPVINEIETYSSNPENFISTNNHIYRFYDKDTNEKEFNCDVIRVYHPLSKTKNNNTIVHVYFIINDLKVHLFCNRYKRIRTKSQTEMVINNNIYSEYIEIKIPSLKELISKDTFYNEDIINIKDVDKYIINVNKNILASTYIWALNYSEYNENSLTFRKYVDDLTDSTLNYPINIILYPFSSLTNDMYLPDDNLSPNSDSFISFEDISISSKLGFNDIGKLVIKGEFEYPNKDKFNNVLHAYQYYKNVSLSEYVNIEYDDDDEHEDYDKDGNLLQKQYQCLYIVELSSDISFKNIIFRSKNIEGVTLFDVPGNKEFEIPIFNSWDQLPEILVCRIIFIDRYLGTVNYSNITVFTKEYYKYLVQYSDTPREIYSIDLQSMQDKFVENIKCVIKKGTETGGISIPQSAPKVIYKPVFYRVQDLQNIQIRQGVTQNIGINLMNYLSKVESFNINIDGNRIVESSRNDSYVIFKIQANKLNTTSGTYHICNQDDEYISSGQWSII